MSRTDGPDGAAEPARTAGAPERDLQLILAAFWVISAVRTLGAFVRHEVFGTEATLALVAMLLLPWLTFGQTLAAPSPPSTTPPPRRTVPPPIPFRRPLRGGACARKHLL